MSHTDNTNPYAIQAQDTHMIRRSFGDARFQESLPFPIGGQNSFRSHAKPLRKLLARRIRARERQFVHRAKFAVDIESVDLMPCRADRRTVLYDLT